MLQAGTKDNEQTSLLQDGTSLTLCCFDETTKTRRENFIHFTLQGPGPLCSKVRAGSRKAGTDPGGTLLTGLLPLVCSARFLIHPRTTSQGGAQCTAHMQQMLGAATVLPANKKPTYSFMPSFCVYQCKIFYHTS